MTLADRIVSDLDMMMNASAFGSAATYTPLAGAPAAITVIFDNDYQAIDVATGQVMSLGPVAHAKSADVAGVKQGDGLTVGGTDYTVTAHEPDGTGLVILRLRKA